MWDTGNTSVDLRVTRHRLVIALPGIRGRRGHLAITHVLDGVDEDKQRRHGNYYEHDNKKVPL